MFVPSACGMILILFINPKLGGHDGGAATTVLLWFSVKNDISYENKLTYNVPRVYIYHIVSQL